MAGRMAAPMRTREDMEARILERLRTYVTQSRSQLVAGNMLKLTMAETDAALDALLAAGVIGEARVMTGRYTAQVYFLASEASCVMAYYARQGKALISNVAV